MEVKRTIAIILGDNDFGMTFKPLLESIYNAFRWEALAFNSEVITTCINEGIRFHYLTFQRGNTHGKSGYGSNKGTVKYLTDNLKILFDDEAEHDIMTNDHDAGAWYLEIITGKVYSY